MAKNQKIYTAFQFDQDDIQLAIRIPYALAFRYLTDEEFNSIRMQADNQNKYGALSMDDYFITPSYIPEEELRKRETLVQAEKERSNTKIERMNANYFQNFLPHEYISGSLFEGINRVIITGNPGVGKSTYSRWLCYKWSKQELNIKGILVQIKLRELKFGKENSLVQYISQHYLNEVDTKRLQKILSTINQDFYFVLDGFDELDDIKQKNLKDDLYQLGSNIKFILLSRPYGLLNSQGLHWDFSFQIDGFNNSNIYNYVDKFLSLNGLQNKREKLFEIITQNRVLEDYAHNPLMLSYITYLFLEDEFPEKRLIQVQSQYDIQDLVFSWIRSHEENKKSKTDLDKLMNEASEFAYQMEITKKLVFTNKETLDKTATIAQYLNFIGLGKMQALAPGQWQYSFNTLTFQEFLAARYLAECINPESFLYLCKEKYFWNFTRMLIGCLSQQGRMQQVESILRAQFEQFEKSQLAIHWYYYIIHLSETSADFLKEKIEDDALDNMYVSYRIAFWDNSIWRPIFLDAIALIYSKFSLSNKLQLQNFILEEFNEILKQNAHNNSPTNIEPAKTLVKKLRLENDLGFLNKVLDLQELMLDKLFSTEDTNNFDTAYEGIMFLFDEVICKAPLQNIHDFHLKTQRLISKNNINLFIVPKAKILLHFSKFKEIADKVYKGCISLEQFLHHHKENEEKKKEYRINYIQFLAMDLYLLGHLSKTESFDEVQKIKPTVKRTTRILLEGIRSTEMDAFDLDETGQLLIEGLVAFNDPELFDWILEAALAIKPSYMVIRIPNNEAFFEYLQSLLKANKKGINEKAMDKLIMSFNIIENARNQFARIREGFSDILSDYIKANINAFENSAGSYVNAQAGTPEAVQYEITQKFNTILNSSIMESEVFSYDKKYLIDRFTAFHNYRYFRSYFNPMIWGREFNLYQSEYWELVLGYTKDTSDFPALMTILRNPSIYRYTSNLLPLNQILQYFFTLSQNDVPANFSIRLLEILSRIMVLIKTVDGNSLPVDKDGLILLIISIVEKFDIITFFYNAEINQLEGKDLLLFPLLFYYTKDNKYQIISDYDIWLSKHRREKKDFIEHLVKVFTKNDKLNFSELKKLFVFLGKKTAKSITRYIKINLELIEPFEVAVFEGLTFINNCHRVQS